MLRVLLAIAFTYVTLLLTTRPGNQHSVYIYTYINTHLNRKQIFGDNIKVDFK